METIYKSNIVKTTLTLTPIELSKNIDEIIKQKIKELYEGRCIKDGYIKKDSISIKKRSIYGELENGLTNGNVNYDIVYSADICNPNENDVLEINIMKSTKVGLIGESFDEDHILHVFIPIEYHQENNLLETKLVNISEKVREGNNIRDKIEVVCKKFNFNDKKIIIIGRLVI